jgi:phosphatidylglycerol:prolipoprotein diacylglycerol transferase
MPIFIILKGLFMLPFLHIYERDIPLYGLMIFLGIALAIIFARRRAPRYGIAKEDVLFMGLYAVIGGLIGAKLLYIIVSFNGILEYAGSENFFTALQVVMSGGFVFYGGLIGGFLSAFYYIKKFKIPFGAMADVAAPVLPLAHAVGRIGCFFAGCCYGIPVPWGVEFNRSPVAPHNVALFPVQLVEAAVNLGIMAVLLLLGRKKRFEGKLIYMYAVMYASMRFALEFFRYDTGRGIFLGLSTSQIISAVMVTLVIFSGQLGCKPVQILLNRNKG